MTIAVMQADRLVNRKVKMSDYRGLDYRNDIEKSAWYLSQKYHELKNANHDEEFILMGKLSDRVNSHPPTELSKPKHILGFESETRERMAQVIAEKNFRVKRIVR